MNLLFGKEFICNWDNSNKISFSGPEKRVNKYMFGLPSNVSEALPVGKISITTKPSETTQPFAGCNTPITRSKTRLLRFLIYGFA